VPQQQQQPPQHERLAVWHGSETQAAALLRAIEHNCECTRNPSGARLQACSAHAMLIGDQRALDGLLFVSSLVARLQAEEGMLELVEVRSA
jgi:hypothetical protein